VSTQESLEFDAEHERQVEALERHDQLCQSERDTQGFDEYCVCDLIRQAEQRGCEAYEAEIAAWGQQHYEQGQRDALAGAMTLLGKELVAAETRGPAEDKRFREGIAHAMRLLSERGLGGTDD
jgi:hypothetical protein